MKALQLKLTRVDQQYVQVDTCNQGSCVKCHTALANSGLCQNLCNTVQIDTTLHYLFYSFVEDFNVL